MKVKLLMLLLVLSGVYATAQTDHPVAPLGKSHGKTRSGALISQASFNKIVISDFATINGLDKEKDFNTYANISLLNDPTLKLNFRVSRGFDRDSANKAKVTYTQNIGADVGLSSDLTDIFKSDFKQYSLKINTTGALFLNGASRFTFYDDARAELEALKAKCRAAVYDPTDRDGYIGIDGKDTTYYSKKMREGQTYVIKQKSPRTDCTEESELQAHWNTKKFHWFSWKADLGLSAVNMFNDASRQINKHFAPTASLDLSYNFFHWIDPKNYRPQWGGTKLISLGVAFGYQPQDKVKQKDYISLADTVTRNAYIASKTAKAYDSASYSTVVRISPHFDFYDFPSRRRIVGFHIGVQPQFDYSARDKWVSDVSASLGLVFNIAGCYGDCDEKQKKSKVNFEIQVLAKNIVANHAKGQAFKDCLVPQLKVGIPISNLM